MRREKKEKWKKIDPQLKQAIRQYRKRFKSEAPFWQTPRKAEYTEPSLKIKKPYNTPTLQFKEYKWKRIIASIILPVIMFIGIGMTISVFKSKTIINEEEVYMTTPFEKGIGLLKIISLSGKDFKDAIDNGIAYEKEIRQNQAQEIIEIGKLDNFNSWWKMTTKSLGNNTETNLVKIGNIAWYMIKEPFVLVYRLADYLIN